MGTNDKHVTGNDAFDNVISSLHLLHEYIQEQQDDRTFAIVFGATPNNEYQTHILNTVVGDFSNPKVFESAVRGLVNTMKESDLVTQLIIAAYTQYKTDRNVKVVKLSVDSPLEAMLLMRKIMEGAKSLSDLENLPTELLEMIIDNVDPDIAQQFFRGEPCDDPDCPACSIRRKLQKKKNNDFPDFPFLNLNPDDKKWN